MSDWARVNELFHEALALPADRRDAFLDESCDGRPDIRQEVVGLLQAHAQAEHFIESPPAGARDLIELAGQDAGRLVGQTLGQYVIRSVIGAGGMGVVYLGEDTRLGRLVAVKAVSARFAGDPTRRERLRREARAAAALTHPGVATVYALEEFDGELYLVSEYLPGETLRDELARGPLALPSVLTTAIELAQALAVAHDRGLVHRDLKPENIVRMPDGRVKILDFGLARFTDDSTSPQQLTAAGTLLGTPAYMSPEQIRGQATDARSDLFSLGVVIYELASGVNPFAGANQASTIAKILEATPPRLAERAPALALLDPVVRQCLQKAQEQRFPSAHALVSALERAQRAPREPLTSDNPISYLLEFLAFGPTALVWWVIHQWATCVVSCLLLYALWFVHHWTPGRTSLLVFLAGLVAAITSTTLRLHMLFAHLVYDKEHAHQRGVARWILVADVALAGVLLAATALIIGEHSSMTIVFVASAVLLFLSSVVIEPATTRAAFPLRGKYEVQGQKYREERHED